MCVWVLSRFWFFVNPVRLLCPWGFPGRNTGVGCHFFLQGIFLIQVSSSSLLSPLHWQADSLPLSHPIFSLLGSRVSKEDWPDWHGEIMSALSSFQPLVIHTVDFFLGFQAFLSPALQTPMLCQARDAYLVVIHVCTEVVTLWVNWI